jgi:hypothetical protein
MIVPAYFTTKRMTERWTESAHWQNPDPDAIIYNEPVKWAEKLWQSERMHLDVSTCHSIAADAGPIGSSVFIIFRHISPIKVEV